LLYPTSTRAIAICERPFLLHVTTRMIIRLLTMATKGLSMNDVCTLARALRRERTDWLGRWGP
jgi:hypothetical protein